MKYYDKNKESSYFQCWHVSSVYGSAMSQKLPVNNFEWLKDFNLMKILKKNYNEENDEWYFPEVDIQYFKNLHELHNHLPFLLERKGIEKVEKLAANLHDKRQYVIDARNLK